MRKKEFSHFCLDPVRRGLPASQQAGRLCSTLLLNWQRYRARISKVRPRRHGTNQTIGSSSTSRDYSTSSLRRLQSDNSSYDGFLSRQKKRRNKGSSPQPPHIAQLQIFVATGYVRVIV